MVLMEEVSFSFSGKDEPKSRPSTRCWAGKSGLREFFPHPQVSPFLMALNAREGLTSALYMPELPRYSGPAMRTPARVYLGMPYGTAHDKELQHREGRLFRH